VLAIDVARWGAPTSTLRRALPHISQRTVLASPRRPATHRRAAAIWYKAISRSIV
jgi:hypothetical protein